MPFLGLGWAFKYPMETVDQKLTSFCSLLPENKIGEYSSNPNDDRRLIELAYVSYSTKQEITIEMFKDELQKWHPDVFENDIDRCAKSCLEQINGIQYIIQIINQYNK